MTRNADRGRILSRHTVIVFLFIITVNRDKMKSERKETEMDFSFLLEEEPMSMYECSKRSGIPYSTLSDIIKGKTPIDRVSAKNLRALADTLGYSMDTLYSMMHVLERTSFETFKSQVRHEVKLLGDVDFINEMLRADMVTRYWRWEWFYEAFYLLAMLDYLCRLNNVQIAQKYNEIREYKLPDTVYPMDIALAAKLDKSLDIRNTAVRESIPEFIKYNIVEKEIRDVY